MTDRSEYLKNPLIEIIYEFRGLWDIPSQCGLRIIPAAEGRKGLIVISDLYDINTGSTVTEYTRLLLKQIEEDYDIDSEGMRIIHTVPDASKYEFLDERFYEILIDSKDTTKPPEWVDISKDKVQALINKS